MTHVPPLQPSASQPSPPHVSNGMGRAGILLAIGGLVLFWIPMVYPTVGVLAITFSAIGYSKARSGAATNGKSAMLGLVLGILSLVLPMVVLLGMATLILEGQ